MTKEERIENLRRGIASPHTPAHLKESMEATLAMLTAPEPPPAPATKPKKAAPKPKPTPPPPPPAREFTEAEKEARIEEYRLRRERKKNREE